MDRDPADARAHQLDLARMDACAYREADHRHPGDDRHRAAHRSGRSVEGREKAIAGGIDLAAPISTQLRADQRMVALEQLLPGAVTELARALGRPDDVREQHGGEDAISLRRRP